MEARKAGNETWGDGPYNRIKGNNPRSAYSRRRIFGISAATVRPVTAIAAGGGAFPWTWRRGNGLRGCRPKPEKLYLRSLPVFSKLTEKEETGWETKHDKNGACAFLDTDGLCRLQKTHGEEFLPDICDSYPRVSYRFGDYAERSLALTCPVAARLALLPDSPMRFEERTAPARRVSSSAHPPITALHSAS